MVDDKSNRARELGEPDLDRTRGGTAANADAIEKREPAKRVSRMSPSFRYNHETEAN